MGIILLIVNLTMTPSIPHVRALAKRFDATKEYVTVNPLTLPSAFRSNECVGGLSECPYETTDGYVCGERGNRILESQSEKKPQRKPDSSFPVSCQ
jgi:hypothetical protein